MANHSDISFSVGACARYQANPKESQLTSVKRIIRYISGTLYIYIFFLGERRKTIPISWSSKLSSQREEERKLFYLDSSMIRHKRVILLAYESQFKR